MIGGDLHIAVKSKIKHKKKKLFNQYLTSPIREEPPGGMAYEVFKQMMTTADTLEDNYTYAARVLVCACACGCNAYLD